MARLGPRCALCRTGYRSWSEHASTATHRAKEMTRYQSRLGNVENLERVRPSWMHRGDQYAVSEAEEAAAMRRLESMGEPEWLGVAIAAGVMVPPDPGDGTYVAEAPISKIENPATVQRPAVTMARPARPMRGHRPDPCHRCGRADFATDRGRTWHLENNPGCAKSRKPERYTYVQIGG